ncbi:MAG: indole-3-glycerol phosphate synthase TrpC [Desulfarculaceae bacterium]|nr:indole-3-glycerol phosphate synthase TrpC [Desulfarculaceae bacterium]MCF8071663.1 indole-3-glycerol phosphate synthase TrpC [Desulfarculaceae bacterium]MCF8102490.1 indole-3-glycerol phosphate synthase TrpC [Desulfarculaceae bacterium]MCF8114942.1 indole-3-glycerol phosphate synthase TrpC [Desulfarculaceae bacterium]
MPEPSPDELGVLARILANKRQEVAALKAGNSLAELKAAAQDAPPARGFLASLRACASVPVIAEIKRRSPSRGELDPGGDVETRARDYARGGAAALSVLTDPLFFGGCLDDLSDARSAVALPALRKDFIIDPIQVHQARLAGADAVLLIAAALGRDELAELYGLARELGMDVLLEVHAEAELEPVLALEPSLVGVNNRNLKTLAVRLETSLELRRLIPPGVTVVAESGISGPEQVRLLRQGGLDAFLVGTSLMQAPDPAAALSVLVGAEEAA